VSIGEVVLRNSIHVLAAAFLMGLAAAAPIGPVNMMAIRRGVVGGWRHTLACALGSVFGDLVLFSLALTGGSYLLPRLSNPKVHIALMAVGAAVLLPVGVDFVALAVGHSRRAYRRARRLWGGGPVSSLFIGEAAKSAALTILNPLSMVYWAAVTSSWLPLAYQALGDGAPGWGILMAGVGLTAWFTALILFVRFVPRRARANVFRTANAVMGVILLGCGTYCAVVLCRHLLT